MAYKSFNQRYPKFKWVLMFAVLLALPLTVFSVQNVSTNTQQHAMLPPGGGGNMPAKLSTPKNLRLTTSCVNTIKVHSDPWVRKFTYSWDAVPSAVGYNFTIVPYGYNDKSKTSGFYTNSTSYTEFAEGRSQKYTKAWYGYAVSSSGVIPQSNNSAIVYSTVKSCP